VINDIGKKPKSLHRDHRKRCVWGHFRDCQHHLIQIHGNQNVNLVQRFSFQRKSLWHLLTQCLLQNSFLQIQGPMVSHGGTQRQLQLWLTSCRQSSPVANTGVCHGTLDLQVYRKMVIWGMEAYIKVSEDVGDPLGTCCCKYQLSMSAGSDIYFL
jgi:hypothetical protein